MAVCIVRVGACQGCRRRRRTTRDTRSRYPSVCAPTGALLSARDRVCTHIFTHSRTQRENVYAHTHTLYRRRQVCAVPLHVNALDPVLYHATVHTHMCTRVHTYARCFRSMHGRRREATYVIPVTRFSNVGFRDTQARRVRANVERAPSEHLAVAIASDNGNREFSD